MELPAPQSDSHRVREYSAALRVFQPKGKPIRTMIAVFALPAFLLEAVTRRDITFKP
jgi:hypothetical protein